MNKSYNLLSYNFWIHPSVYFIKDGIKLFFVVVQQPQAALHVPNVRAECLLKFQLRPVMEWQRFVSPCYGLCFFLSLNQFFTIS